MRPGLGARRLVLKVGSAVLAGPGGLDPGAMGEIARQVLALREEGREVVLVSSGAVAAGMGALGLPRPQDMPLKQALAAVGQPLLMALWREALAPVPVAQVLLTAEDLASRTRYLNAKATLEALLRLRVVPIINENDTVAFEEIRFGDNDQLSARVAALVGAGLLLLLSDVEALYEEDPKKNPEARPIPEVERVEAVLAHAGGGNPLGSGGMRSKLLAARLAGRVGIPTLLLPGRRPGVVLEALGGSPLGTYFHAKRRYRGEKAWLYGLLRPKGELVLDGGAVRALRERGASLLPAGVKEVRGRFGRGEAVRLLAEGGEEVGVGLANYAAEEIARIRGRRSGEIEAILGYRYTEEVVHRDHLVLKEEA
ncbi:MAG: glutamate 5-kinase [Thermus sp.]|uniref:glutamate 5-kinase n=1 Tax=Thermus sp. TaxID=275 RepID=UPI0025DFF35B|nr:glutamate 5-kinase [Thermus sp.]MCS6867678.1 glutamate 5-kinase [Thermus sp.]MCS7217490.1 glutamate 5-kinase [Thermus sp.]MCX7848835.1 glutamate 5-kinase [Thermus sp.]MDW8016728.1 glutamate 5-kinase [Thermus sp.]